MPRVYSNLDRQMMRVERLGWLLLLLAPFCWVGAVWTSSIHWENHQLYNRAGWHSAAQDFLYQDFPSPREIVRDWYKSDSPGGSDGTTTKSKAGERIVFVSLISLLIYFWIGFAGVRLIEGQDRPMGLVACLRVALPVSPFVLIGLPVGLWGWWTLSNPLVVQHMRATRRNRFSDLPRLV